MKTDLVSSIVRVAIIGQPNVGKSTLFNRLSGARSNITDRVSGTTRDRVYRRVCFHEKEVYLTDTGGMQYAKGKVLDAFVDREVTKALIEATVVVLVCEASGLSDIEYQLARDIRRMGKTVVLVVNKVDMQETAAPVNDFYVLGFGEPLFISAIHGTNVEAVIDRVHELLPPVCHIPSVEPEFRLAIMGEPNAGKSTLLNTFLEDARVVVSEIPGTTRDFIEEDLVYEGRTIRLVDTAGIKKKKKIKTTAGLFSLFRTQKCIHSIDVACLIIDATKGPQKDSRNIYSLICEEHKGCIIAVNKWDLVKEIPMEEYKKRLIDECGFLCNTPICFISAQTGRHVDVVLDQALVIWDQYTTSITTKELNDFLEYFKRMKPPAPVVRLKYLVQVGIKPPTFILFVKNKKHIKKNYSTFLLNTINKEFSLHGVMPRLFIKEEKEK